MRFCGEGAAQDQDEHKYGHGYMSEVVGVAHLRGPANYHSGE